MAWSYPHVARFAPQGREDPYYAVWPKNWLRDKKWTDGAVAAPVIKQSNSARIEAFFSGEPMPTVDDNVIEGVCEEQRA